MSAVPKYLSPAEYLEIESRAEVRSEYFNGEMFPVGNGLRTDEELAMSALPKPKYISPEEYLEIESRAEVRSEYFNGEMFLMAGASTNHNQITFNLAGTLFAQLRGKSCRGFTESMRVHIPATGLYAYPDALIVCGELQMLEGRKDTLLNPVVIIEVLSPSTAGYDRSDKFDHYRSIPTLAEYVTLWQDKARAAHYTRQTDGSWRLVDVIGRSSELELSAVGCRLAFADVYDRVEFESNEGPFT